MAWEEEEGRSGTGDGLPYNTKSNCGCGRAWHEGPGGENITGVGRAGWWFGLMSKWSVQGKPDELTAEADGFRLEGQACAMQAHAGPWGCYSEGL